MFVLKKIVSQLLYPLPVCLLLAIIGVVLLWCTRRQKTGKVLVSLSVMGLLAFSYGLLPRLLLEPLERTFPPLAPAAYRATSVAPDLPAVSWVAVLAGGLRVDPQLAATSQLNPSSLARLVEGIRLHRHLPESKLLLSAGFPLDAVPTRNIVSAAAQALGVEPRNIVVSPYVRDTHEEAVAFQTFVGREPFILVTSAVHMPRAMALFTKLYMRPIPAPADHRITPPLGTAPDRFFPRPRWLGHSAAAIHEYVGMLWAKFRGQA